MSKPLLPLAVAACLAVGCVERKLLIRSDPPGARVFLDGRLVGTTSPTAPLAVPFDHYGTRLLTLRLTGHVPSTTPLPLDPPWYQLPPFDFVADLLWPGTIEDAHPVSVSLQRRLSPPPPDALQRHATQHTR